MTREMSLDDVLQEIVHLVKDFLACDSCLIYLIEDDELVLCASSDPSRKNLGQVRLRLSEGLTGWVARERRLLAISRLRHYLVLEVLKHLFEIQADYRVIIGDENSH